MPGDLEVAPASDTAALGHTSPATDIHTAPSTPGNPSVVGDVAVSKTQKDPGSITVDYLATPQFGWVSFWGQTWKSMSSIDVWWTDP